MSEPIEDDNEPLYEWISCPAPDVKIIVIARTEEEAREKLKRAILGK